MKVSAILFDLDGTLIDSAPDLAGAANDLLQSQGLPVIAYERLRPMVGGGARGMLQVTHNIGPEHAEFEALREEFLTRYAARLLRETRLFAHVTPMLSALEVRDIPWGIVTNKASRFTRPIVTGLGLGARAKTVVSGDTTAYTKPHPGPLLEAARQMCVEPSCCVYVGDDRRDVQAAHAAGMVALVANWGYLGPDADVPSWRADAMLTHAGELLQWLNLA